MTLKFNLKNLGIKGRLAVMSGVLILLLVAISAFALIALEGFRARSTTNVDLGAASIQAVDTGMSAQVNFKKQVQEWKNILLRGFERENFDRYLAAFIKDEAQVQKDLSSLRGLMVQLRLRTDGVDALLKTHAEMGAKYREALKSYDPDKADSHRVVDALVRGMDRAPTDAMDALVESIKKHADSAFKEMKAQSVAEYGVSRNVTIALALAAIVFGASLLFFTTRFVTRTADRLNDSIIDILRSVSTLARGDLRVHAPVREDVTGALSDAINSMADATAKAIANVNASSQAVRSESQTGRETVLSTAKGMNEVRGTIQETGKRIKRLGERSQEIGGIIKLIDDIAERTSVLALNANMQAAVAGEAGRGFRVVADEVQRLAERSKEATDQIAKLVSAIQSETNETIVTMEKAISEVVKGGELAEKAAEQVSGLEKLGSELYQAVQAFTLPEEALAAHVRRAA
jgi:methyl-accepting chemotaxis protein